MKRPRVTVGVPVYNGQEYLGETLESLLNQTFEDFQIVIGDNASTDGTEGIARRFAARHARIQYLRHPHNLGAAANYSRLFALADTEYFRWSASDDLCEPNMLELCVAELDRHPDVVLAYPRVMLMDETGTVREAYQEGLQLPQERPSTRFAQLLSNIRRCNALYGLLRSEAVARTRLMGSFRGSDIVFQAELALYGKFSELSGTVFYRRMHAKAFSQMSVEEQRRFYLPNRRLGAEFRSWRHFCEHLRSIVAAPIGSRERLRVFAWLTRQAVRERDAYWDDLVEGVRSSIGR